MCGYENKFMFSKLQSVLRRTDALGSSSETLPGSAQRQLELT